MEKSWYSSDGGSAVRFANGFGDGDFKVYKFENAKVLNYDFYHDVDDKKASDNTIMVLNGEYVIKNYGKFYFCKSGENKKE